MPHNWEKGMGAALLAGACLLSGCRHGGDGDTAQVRLINAVPDPGELSVAVGGRTVWKHSPYRNNTGYQKIHPGQYQVALESALESGGPAAPQSIALEKGKTYTVLALGAARTAPPAFRVFGDDPGERPPDGKAGLRFINAVPGLGGTDVLFNNIVGLKRVAYGQRSDELLLDAGAYDIKVNVAGEVAPLIGPISLRLEPGHAYTLVAMGRRPVRDLTLEAYPDGN